MVAKYLFAKKLEERRTRTGAKDELRAKHLGVGCSRIDATHRVGEPNMKKLVFALVSLLAVLEALVTFLPERVVDFNGKRYLLVSI